MLLRRFYSRRCIQVKFLSSSAKEGDRVGKRQALAGVGTKAFGVVHGELLEAGSVAS
jgi:hypothetical protein